MNYDIDIEEQYLSVPLGRGRRVPSRQAKSVKKNYVPFADLDIFSDHDDSDEYSKHNKTKSKGKKVTKIKSATTTTLALTTSTLSANRMETGDTISSIKQEIIFKTEPDEESILSDVINDVTEDPEDSAAARDEEGINDGALKAVIKTETDDSLITYWTTSAFTIKAVVSTATASANQKSGSGSSDSKKSQNSKFENPSRNHNQSELHPKPTSRSRPPFDKATSCPICKIELSRWKLKVHVAHEHKGVDKPFTCDLCQSKWKDASSLKRHFAKHSDDRPWACSTCDKSFKRELNLRDHEYYHHTEEGSRKRTEMSQQARQGKEKVKVSTAVIQKEKGYRIGNKGHRIMPGDLPPYKCPQADCSQEFPTPPSLQRHHASVHLERPFICEICGSTWTTSTLLNVHMATHTDLRPYVCDQCGASYKSKSQLNLHFRRNHDPQGHEDYKAYSRMLQKRQRQSEIIKLNELGLKKVWKKKKKKNKNTV